MYTVILYFNGIGPLIVKVSANTEKEALEKVYKSEKCTEQNLVKIYRTSGYELKSI